MAYCMAPFRNVYINNGTARPCCWYDRKDLTNKVETLTEAVDVFYSTEFDNIRNSGSVLEMSDARRPRWQKSSYVME